MTFSNLESIGFSILIFSVIALILKPLIVMIAMGLAGFRKRTSFLSGASLGQISEFSLILVFLGGKLGHISQSTVSLITIISIVAFIFSAYIIGNDNKLYIIFHHYLNFLERKNGKKDEIIQSKNDMQNLNSHIVLIGADQMGESILETLKKMNKEIVVIDFDPVVVENLKNEDVHRLFGDISDSEIRDIAKIHTAHLIISTIPNAEDNTLLLREIKSKNGQAKVIVTALDVVDARALYREAADYVVLPHLAGGRQLAKILEKDLDEISALKEKDQRYL